MFDTGLPITRGLKQWLFNKALSFNTCYKLTVDVQHSQDTKPGWAAGSSGSGRNPEVAKLKEQIDEQKGEIKQLQDVVEEQAKQLGILVERITRCEDIIAATTDAEDEDEAAPRPKRARKGKGKGDEGKGNGKEGKGKAGKPEEVEG